MPTYLDTASRNVPEGDEPQCQICSFIRETRHSVVPDIYIEEIVDNSKHLLFTSRSAWFSIQNECPDLRCTCAVLKQSTRN